MDKQTHWKGIVLEPSKIPGLFLRLEELLCSFFQTVGFLWSIYLEIFALIVFVFINLILPGNASPASSMYFFQPLLWLSLGCLAWLGWRYGLKNRPTFRPSLLSTVILLAFFQIAILTLSGLVFGFGHSPYSHQFFDLIGNLFYVAAMLAGIELTRAYLIVLLGRRHLLIAFIIVTLLFTLLTTPLSTILNLESLPNAIEKTGERFLPDLAENLLATLLAFIGGPIVSFIYRMIVIGFEWLSPVLPNLNWFMKAFLGTMIPGFGMILFYNQYIAKPAVEETDQTEKPGSFIPWAIVSILSLALLGFSAGLFGVRPSLIVSGSMSPHFLVGDIVITKKLPVDEIQVGDVISFHSYGSTIIHRVIEISNGAGQTTFITQGDANTSPDQPISAYNYQGKVVFSIPKIGWASIFIRNALANLVG